VEHRLAVASGGPPRRIFTASALRSVHRAARGIPRLINLVSHRALLRAYASDRTSVSASVVKQAIAELADPLIGSPAPRRFPVAAAGAVAAAAVVVGAWGFLPPGFLRSGTAPTAVVGAASGGEETAAAERPGAAVEQVAAAGPEARAPEGAPPPADAAASGPTPGVVAVAPGGIQVSPVELGDALVDATAPPYLAPVAAGDAGSGGIEVERLAFLEAVQQSSPGQSAYEATEALLRTWGVEPLEPAEAAGNSLDLPEIARQRGLRYLALQGNLNTLRVLDLPAILEVAPDDGSPARFVTLEQLGEANARVAVGRDALDMQPIVLAEAWFGKAHLFWQDLDRLGPFLAIGTSSDAVARLHERLRAARVYGGDASPVFAAETEEAVLRFQQRERLVADGKVGPMTMIALYRRTSPERLPRLGDTAADQGVAAVDYGGSGADRWVGTWEGRGP
jgi:hypothetical protein